MNKKNLQKNLANDHLIRAEKSLRSAKILLEQGLNEDSISRSYYSIYHSIHGMLLSIGLTGKTHKGQMHLFYTHFVVTKEITIELNSKINKVLNARSDADYGSIPIFNSDDAKEAIDISTEMYDKAIEWIDRI